MEVKGTTQVYGLIGNPVSHTLSPMLHHALAESEERNMVYVPFLVEGNLPDAVKGAYELGIQGMNVTVPHKNQVLDSLVEVDHLAKALGAVNTLVRVTGGYAGYNTDIIGLRRALLEEGITIAGETIVILGAGGAGRGAAFMCANEKAKKVYLLNRTYEKAEEIAKQVNLYNGSEVVVPLQLSSYATIEESSYIAIQASSVGLSNPEQVILEEEEFYERVQVGYDMVYKPFETKFMKLVESKGKKAYNGLKMLLYQGVASYELWNSCVIPEEVSTSLYDKMKMQI
ncbi:MAG: shikimate dehydrogenase [Eubacteriales bacterium]